MTYDELLEITAKKKTEAIKELNGILKEGDTNLGAMLAKAEIERNLGTVAWIYLAKDFCETLAEHVDEFIEQAGVDSYEAHEIFDIYVAYACDDPELYDLLPIEAQLFAS